MPFETKQLSSKPDAIALDGSEVRILCGLSRGSLSVFTLPAHTVARAVAHRTIEEVWYVIAGTGQMWRRLGDRESVVAMEPGVIGTYVTRGARASRLLFSASRRKSLSYRGLGEDEFTPNPFLQNRTQILPLLKQL